MVKFDGIDQLVAQLKKMKQFHELDQESGTEITVIR